MNPELNPLVSTFHDKALLIGPNTETVVAAILKTIMAHERHEALMVRPNVQHDDFWPAADSWMAQFRPYVVKDGILQIPVLGLLLNRFAFQFGRWATGYTYIERAFERGIADPQVRGIAMIHDSPGGHAAGNFELADRIYAWRSEKPIRSFVADMSLSGSFSLATSAHKVIVTRSGETGSVGVLTSHLDVSQWMENQGLKLTYIYKGDHKVDGNAYEPLADSVKERWLELMTKTYDTFVSTVARNRSMPESDVVETQALIYDADESVEVGFADRIGALEEEIVVFANDPFNFSEDEDTMTVKGISVEDHEAAVAAARAEGRKEAETAAQASTNSAVSDARTAGASGERERINKIMGLESAKDRQKQAMTLATETDLTPEQADKVLQASPTETKTTAPANGSSHFASAMSSSLNPEVPGEGAGSGDDDDGTPQAKSNRIIGNYRKATGRKPADKAA